MSELTMAAQEAVSGFFSGGTGSSVLQWGLEAIRAFQGARPAVLTAVARLVSDAGSALAYIAIIAITHWCVDERRAFRAGIILFVSNGLNIGLKEWIREPRPYALDPSINLAWEPTLSFPSGHSQNAAAFWPALLAGKAGKPRKAAIALFLAIPFLIGLSRVYLGVHYPTDVLGGWAVGALVAAAGLVAAPRLVRFARETPIQPIAGIRESYRARIIEAPRTAATFRLALAAMGAIALNALGGEDTSMGGILFGYAAGPALLSSDFRAAEGSVVKKAARLAVGLVGLAILYFGLKLAFPGEGTPLYRLARFVRYGLCGFWASGLAPYLFLKTGLSRSGR